MLRVGIGYHDTIDCDFMSAVRNRSHPPKGYENIRSYVSRRIGLFSMQGEAPESLRRQCTNTDVSPVVPQITSTKI